MEKLLLSRLEWYLEHNNLYPPSMAGFRCGRRGIDNVIELVTNIQQAKSTEDIAIAVFVDEKGAFDSVQHGAISRIMSRIGIAGRLYP